MSRRAEERIEYGSVDKLFDVQVKGKIDPAWRLQRQLERCNVLMCGQDVSIFEAAVRALLGDIPLRIKARVLKRSKDFNDMIKRPIVSYWCGVPQYKYDDDGKRIPPEVVEEETTDYEKLFAFIKEELEIGGTTWRYDTKKINIGEVEKPISKKITNFVTDKMVEALLDLRAKGYVDLSFQDIVASQIGLKPPTPTFTIEEEEANEDE